MTHSQSLTVINTNSAGGNVKYQLFLELSEDSNRQTSADYEQNINQKLRQVGFRESLQGERAVPGELHSGAFGWSTNIRVTVSGLPVSQRFLPEQQGEHRCLFREESTRSDQKDRPLDGQETSFSGGPLQRQERESSHRAFGHNVLIAAFLTLALKCVHYHGERGCWDTPGKNFPLMGRANDSQDRWNM